ncbi:MAG: tRNA dihydrouridine synthase DusB [Tissierellia bacterium]|nr:tRNA dihydrouridine synthase DusB [Tissierellia bacterium]
MLDLFPSKLLLGPMAGVTDYAFRRLLREMGLEYSVSEMISAKGICYGNERTIDYAKSHESDHPLALQIFGSDPDYMVRAALYLEKNYQYEVLDINMGCPVKKIFKNGEGSALMKNEKLAMEIVASLVEHTSKPVSVKIRTGISEENKNAVRFARAMERAGASMVVVHGRTTQQMYSGRANWEDIARVKEALQIPVIGNGDISSLQEGLEKMRSYQVDAVMVARALRGNPFLVRDYKNYFEKGLEPLKPSMKEVVDAMRLHFSYLVEEMGEVYAASAFRKHGLWYVRDFAGSAKFRDRLSNIKSGQDLDDILSAILDIDY